MTRKSNKKKKNIFKKIKIFLLIMILLGILGAGTVSVVVYNIIQDAPPIDPGNMYSILNQNSFIYDDKEILIEKVQSDVLRTNVNYEDLPEDLVNAFVSIEDKTFWKHKGFNVIRIFGAIWDGISSGERIKGTSTITQQLARNLYLPDKMTERSLNRKVKEAYYALEIEKVLNKKQILEGYMNTIYLGSGVHGVQAASQAYFSKDVSELTLAECSLIAGITKNPARYSPIKRLANEEVLSDNDNIISIGEIYTTLYDERFKDRQELVLYFMKKYEYITEEEYDNAIDTDMKLYINPLSISLDDMSSYFVDQVKYDVISALTKELDISETEAYDMLYTKGLKIYSTIDTRIQKIVETEFEKSSNFPSLRTNNKDSSGNILDSHYKIMLYKASNLIGTDDVLVIPSGQYAIDQSKNLTLYKNKVFQFHTVKENDKISDINVNIKSLYTTEDTTFYIINSGKLLIPSTFKSLDTANNLVINNEFFANNAFYTIDKDNNLLISKNYYVLSDKTIQPQSAMVIMDYNTGAIKALVGGRNTTGRKLFNRALHPKQPGSSIKPLAVYTPAIDSGLTAGTVIDDVPFFLENGTLWPKNWYPGYKGLTTIRKALEQSVNVIAVKLVDQLGVETSIEYLKKFRISSLQETGPYSDRNLASMALGGMTNGISPLELTAAYGTIANSGVYIKPISFTKVTDLNGNILIDNIAIKERVLSPQTAFIMTDMLKSAVTSGTGWRAKIYADNIRIPIAGKTGTTSNSYDAWFVGFSPYYSSALWIGNDINLQLSSGSSASAQLWKNIMVQVHKDYPAKSFSMPEGIISATIDTKSGKLPTKLSHADPRGDNIRSEYFIDGTEPTTYDDVHVALDIDITTGQLATPLCPPTLVEKRVFIKRAIPFKPIVLGSKTLVPADYIYEAPIYYCELHNSSYNLYPVENIPVDESIDQTTKPAILQNPVDDPVKDDLVTFKKPNKKHKN